jgi:ribonucleoside-diphosphate reductase alpha chain
MQITRRFTKSGNSPYEGIPFASRTSRIVNPDGSVVFEAKDIQVPEHWSQIAVDILAQKYFRKAGVPARTRRVAEPGVPEWVQRREPDAEALAALPEDGRDGMPSATPAKSSTAWPGAGRTGGGSTATSPARRTRGPTTTRCATCSRARWPRPTARSGSTRACTGPTASRARRRATASSIP